MNQTVEKVTKVIGATVILLALSFLSGRYPQFAVSLALPLSVLALAMHAR